MPGIRANANKTMKDNADKVDTSKGSRGKKIGRALTRKNDVTPTTKTVPDGPEGYSPRSPILKSYQAGEIPLDHRKLLNAIKQALGGAQEGIINLGEVIAGIGVYRASALKMLGHMQNFGVLESEARYHGTWVKILKD